VIKTRIKICGITRAEDGVSAAELGADAIGLVFYPKSPRYVSIERAINIISSLPSFICRVGLFVNHDEEAILSILRKVSLDVLQFHGDESAEECRQFSKPYIKAIRMCDDIDLISHARNYVDAAALLLDTHVDGMVGGTGKVFDWDRIPKSLPQPVTLAGGLNSNNVSEAIYQVKPYAVDVSGGVESSKGIKDSNKMKEFVMAVQSL